MTAIPSGAAGFVVTTTDDVVANDGLISLREAIANANANAGVDTITFDATVFNDASDIIPMNSELTITDSIVIQGATFDPTDATGLSRITISGDSLADGGLIGAGDADGFGDTNLFRVTSGSADVAFQDLVLRDGSSTFQAGAINAELGHDVTLENVTVTENRGGAGGGIRATGGFFTLRNGIVSDNTSINANVGGGILANDFSVINSTISGNTANQGGGIYTVGDGTIVNTTISGNTATNAGGGGIFASTGAEVRITNSTITQNSATGGGGILAANGTFYLANTVIAQNTATGNSARDDVGTFGAGVVYSLGNNFIGKAGEITGTSVLNGDQVGTDAAPLDPLLGALADNGGGMRTHTPLAGSPLVNTGDTYWLFATNHQADINGDGTVDGGDDLTTDQIGNARVQTGWVDIGAVEFSLFRAPELSINDNALAVNEGETVRSMPSPRFTNPTTVATWVAPRWSCRFLPAPRRWTA